MSKALPASYGYTVKPKERSIVTCYFHKLFSHFHKNVYTITSYFHKKPVPTCSQMPFLCALLLLCSPGSVL